jgi:hypothetical protein
MMGMLNWHGRQPLKAPNGTSWNNLINNLVKHRTINQNLK